MRVTEHPIHLDPIRVRAKIETSETMLGLRDRIRERFHTSPEEAGAVAERLLTHAVERFGGRYLDAMIERIKNIFENRDRVRHIIDQVIGLEALSPTEASTRLKGLFEDIQRDMDAIVSPERFAKSEKIAPPDEIAFEQDLIPEELERARDPERNRITPSNTGEGAHYEPTSVLHERFNALPADQQAALKKAAELAPGELWSAISSEVGPEFKGAPSEPGKLPSNEAKLEALKAKARAGGMKDIEALDAAVRTMNYERNVAQRGPGTTEHALRAKGLAGLEPNMRELVKGNWVLENFAANNPEFFTTLTQGKTFANKSELASHIRHNMIYKVAAFHGEMTAVFALGKKGMAILKMPELFGTGTDFIGITEQGRLKVGDNKAWKTEKSANRVEALMEHFPGNLDRDAAMLNKAFENIGSPEVKAAAEAFADISSQIKELPEYKEIPAGLSRAERDARLRDPVLQRKIGEICKQHGIDRIITNVGGNIEGLGEALENALIIFEDLNRPAQ